MKKFLLALGLIIVVGSPAFAALKGGIFSYDITYDYHTDYVGVHIVISEASNGHLFDIDINVPKEDLSKK